MDNDINLLRRCIEDRSPILLLGAGFSLGAKGRNGQKLMLGGALAQRLYEEIIIPNKDLLTEEALDTVSLAIKWGNLFEICNVIRENNLTTQRDTLFQEWMSECTYNDAPYFSNLIKVDWKYIFTLNIDDLVEHIFKNEGHPLLCWKLSSERYADDPDKTVLIKLHGDVGDPDTYVFDEKEYRDFSSRDNWMLRQFADLYISHDVIILGTQFQEKDLEIALAKVFDYGCDNSNFHYFFISPGDFKGKVADEINSKPNFHHIKWKTDEFLAFIDEQISQPKDAVQNICSQGITFWNKELANAHAQRENWGLYYGNPSQPLDFYYNVDIPHKVEEKQIEEFFDGNSYGFVEIKGKPYVGKTCLAKRALTLGVEKMFKAFYSTKIDLHCLQVVGQYLENSSPDDLILFCFEDAAGFYKPLIDLVEKYKSHLKKLIMIVISGDITQSANKYVFGAVPLLQISLTEKVNSVLANSMYEKLNEKTQLGKLVNYADRRKDIINYIKQINDFIDVLYVAHHGKRFSEYFDSWMKLRDTDKQFPVFQSVTLLTTVGIPDISINYLPEMAASLKIYNFNYPQFIQSFGEFCSDEDGLLRLRCSRLFSSVVLGNLTIDAKANIIRNLVYELSKDLKEGDRTCNNEIFKHLIRASSLTKIVGLDKQRAIDFLIELKESCKHLSYYWIQLGILYRTSEQFEEAENAFEYAKNAHGCENYQIAHTTAKNYMEWGLWSITNAPSQATHLFEQGTTKILEVLWTWTYPDAICFSAHSYIDMNIKYYSKLHMVPSHDTWLAMNACLDKYVNNANRVDRLLGDLFSNMCKFAKTNGLEIEHEQDVRRRLNQKVYDSTYVATEWSIDELPLYE